MFSMVPRTWHILWSFTASREHCTLGAGSWGSTPSAAITGSAVATFHLSPSSQACVIGCPVSICHLLVCHRSLNCGECHHFASSYTEDTRIKAVLNPMEIFDVTRVLTLWVNRISLIQTLHSSFGEKYNCYSINMAQ